MEEIKIAYSKGKLGFLVGLSVLFVLIGLWAVTSGSDTIIDSEAGENPVFVYGAGIITILFFGLCAVIGTQKLMSPKPGLVLNKRGINDFSSGISNGFIPWSDIETISTYKIKQQEFIAVMVRNPEVYSSRGGLSARMAKKANWKLYGTPVNISTSSLAIDTRGLMELLKKGLTENDHNSAPQNLM